MKNLKEYISESIFDIEDNIDNIDESIKDQIKQFLNNNFKNASNCIISEKPNKYGKFEVLSTGDVVVKNKSITSLTNGLFIWTNIKGDFTCSNCNSLTSLEGAPKEVKGDFICSDCNSLKSLEGAPKEVRGDFNCFNCNLLISLEGAPEEVGGDFFCSNCTSLTSLKGAPKEVGGAFNCGYCTSLTSLKGASKEVGGYFSCEYCNSLKSLEGAPKEVGGGFYCIKCGYYFTQEDVKNVSNVKGIIYV